MCMIVLCVHKSIRIMYNSLDSLAPVPEFEKIVYLFYASTAEM